MNLQSITGGDISDAFLLKGEKKNYFIKINDSSIAADLFKTESKGLGILSKHCRTPEVLHHGTFEDRSVAFLILNYIPTGKKDKVFWASLAKKTNFNFPTAYKESSLEIRDFAK